jgi:hypothetical protein
VLKGEGAERCEEAEELGEVRVLVCRGGIVQDEREVTDVAREGRVGREDAEKAAGMGEFGCVAVGDAEGEGMEEASMGWCEEGMGDNRSAFEGGRVDVIDNGVDEFLGEGGDHGLLD